MSRKLMIAAVAVALAGVLSAGSAEARSLRALIAPPAACPHQSELGDPSAVQVQAMRCMTNFARLHSRRHRFGDAAALDRSASRKNRDIVHCDDFSHYACGRSPTYWIGRSGYLSAACWRAAENIAWGVRADATVRSIFVAWIHSPEHLANILGPYSQIGIALEVGDLHGHGSAHVWTQDFGSHCGAPTHSSRAESPRIGLRQARRAH